MPSGAQWPYVLLAGVLASLVVLEEWLRRSPARLRRAARARAMHKLRERQPAAVLLAPVVVLSAVWLIPWAAALANSGLAALLPGLLVLALLVGCMRRALADEESDE
jgi:hypothetical protein